MPLVSDSSVSGDLLGRSLSGRASAELLSCEDHANTIWRLADVVLMVPTSGFENFRLY